MAKTTQAKPKRATRRPRTEATATSEATPTPEASGSSELSTLDDEEDLDPELDALVGLAQMDSEAVAAYECVAESLDEPRLAEMLRRFAEDHQRHVTDIQQLVATLGGDSSFASPDPDISTFATLASAAIQFGPDAGLRSLVASEQFTNATYEAALELSTSPEARAVIQRNFEDEQRHIQALTQELQRTEQAEDHAAD